MNIQVDKKVKILKASDALQYEQVQNLSLKAAKNFIAIPEAYKWYSIHEKYPTLGVFHNELLISVMRLEWITTWPELNAKMNSNFFLPEIKFPVAYLTKGGTRPEFMSLGLNTLLRYHAIQISKQWSLNYLLGTMIKGSSRVETMIKLGYDFHINPIKWQGAYQSNENALIGILNLKTKADYALSFIEKNYNELISDYKIDFEYKNIQITLN